MAPAQSHKRVDHNDPLEWAERPGFECTHRVEVAGGDADLRAPGQVDLTGSAVGSALHSLAPRRVCPCQLSSVDRATFGFFSRHGHDACPCRASNRDAVRPPQRKREGHSISRLIRHGAHRFLFP